MGFLLAHIAWQIDQFPICWPMNGIFVHWSRGWGVLSFSERLVHYVPKDKSDVNAKGRGQRSKVKVAKVNTQLSRFRTATPVWINIWWWNGAQSFMLLRRGALLFFSCDQAALWMVFSVRLSVRLSVCLSVCPSHLFDYVPIIVSSWNFQELSPRTRVTSMQKVKVTEVTTQLSRFRTVTPVWIHIWWWNDMYSLMLLTRGALLFFKVIRQSSRSHGTKKHRIWPRLGVSGL